MGLIAYVSPTTARSTLGSSAGSRPPAPTPTEVTVSGGSGPQPDTVAASRAAPVGVVISCARRPALHRRTGLGEKREDGGAGHRDDAVLPADPARAQGHRGGEDAVDGQGVQRRGDPHDVGDGVECADLVEVHVLGIDAVHRALRAGQPGERVRGQRPHGRRQSRGGQQGADVPPGPVRLRVGADGDLGPGGADAVPGGAARR